MTVFAKRSRFGLTVNISDFLKPKRDFFKSTKWSFSRKMYHFTVWTYTFFQKVWPFLCGSRWFFIIFWNTAFKICFFFKLYLKKKDCLLFITYSAFILLKSMSNESFVHLFNFFYGFGSAVVTIHYLKILMSQLSRIKSSFIKQKNILF